MHATRAESGDEVRLYASRGRGKGLLVSGLALLGLGAFVIAFSTGAAGLRGDRELLFATGLLMALGGFFIAWLGARPRRHWIRCDERGVSQPWAVGKPRIAWREIADVKMSRSGGFSVHGQKGGARLRIAPELDDYEGLLDEICDQLNENRGAPLRRLWRSRSGEDAVRLNVHTLDIATADGVMEILIRDIVDVFMAADERLRQTPVLTLKSGESLLLPSFGDLTLELYRALRLRRKAQAQTSVSQLVSR